MPFDSIINDRHTTLSTVQTDEYFKGVPKEDLSRQFMEKYGDEVLMDLSQSGAFNDIEAKSVDDYLQKVKKIIADNINFYGSDYTKKPVGDEVKYLEGLLAENKRLSTF